MKNILKIIEIMDPEFQKYSVAISITNLEPAYYMEIQIKCLSDRSQINGSVC
jgi:hypothetical protein